MKDSVVEEVLKFRNEHDARFNYDLHAIYADMKRIESESKEPRVSLGPRREERARTGTSPHIVQKQNPGELSCTSSKTGSVN